MGMIVNWHEALIDTFQLVMQRAVRAFDYSQSGFTQKHVDHIFVKVYYLIEL